MSPFDVEVFYDGDCPLCMSEIGMLRRRDRAKRILFTDITAAGFDPGSIGVDHDVLMKRIHARLPSGELIEGVEVFRRLYAAVGFPRLVAMTRLPVVSHGQDLAYKVFANNRLRLTGRCAKTRRRRRRSPVRRAETTRPDRRR